MPLPSVALSHLLRRDSAEELQKSCCCFLDENRVVQCPRCGVNCNVASLDCSQRQQFCTPSRREKKIKAERVRGEMLLSRSQKL